MAKKMISGFFMGNENEIIYDFNADGQLIDTKTGNRFVYKNESDYKLLGKWITERVYRFLISPPYSLRCKLLTGKDVTNLPTFPTNKSFVFISENFESFEKVVVLIHGSGDVRAGQWSRRLIVNKSLCVGTQLPYVQRCLSQGWGVLVLNTNDTFYYDENGVETLKSKSYTPEEHAINTWTKFILDNGQNISKIAIVAHSYGGKVATAILSIQSPESLAKIRSISLIDAIFSRDIFTIIERKIPTRHWVVSDLPLDEPFFLDDMHVSAGTNEHCLTPASSMNSVLKYVSELFES